MLKKENLLNPSILKDFPFDKVYEITRKEASRKKPIFFIHKYFARRITTTFRLILLGLLLNEKEDIFENFYKSINLDEKITLLDPFMGGGTTIFESLRLGINTIGNDLQPLSKFVTYGEVSEINFKRVEDTLKILEESVGNRIKEYYKTTCPNCSERADVIYNFHVKEINYNGEQLRLFSNYVIADDNKTYTIVCPECFDVFKIDKNNQNVECPTCKNIISDVRSGIVKRGKIQIGEISIKLSDLKIESGYPKNTKIYAQEVYCPHCQIKTYKKVLKEDEELFERSKKEYHKLKDGLPIPEQVIPIGHNTNQIINHSYKQFKELFNERQLLCLGMLLKEIEKIEEDDVKYWFLLAFSGALEMNNMFCRYQSNAFKIGNIFFNHAYVPISMPVENNVWGTKLGTGSFTKTINKILKGKEFNTNIYDISINEKNDSVKIYSDDKVVCKPIDTIDKISPINPLLMCGDSKKISNISDSSVDIIVTDPPYGNNLMYSELIDFFHVWLNKSEFGRKNGFKELFSPKVEEIIVNKHQNKSFDDYEKGLTEVFSECNRVLKDYGFMVFTFHDSSLDSWSSIMKATYYSNFELIEAYPIHSEARTGAHTSLKNSIIFDIILIFRKKSFATKKNNEINLLLRDIEKEAMDKTEKMAVRLKSINAEITLPDIENIFISQFFIEVFRRNLFITFEDVIKILKEELKKLEEYFSDFELTIKRTGWWSELYSK